MKKNLLCKKLVFLFAVAVLFALSSVSAFAEVTFEDGKLMGLKASTSYEYTHVTLDDYNTSLEVADLSDNTFTPFTSNANGEYSSAIDAGIICIREKNTTDNTFVWVEGDTQARTTIGRIVDGHLDYKYVDAQHAQKPGTYPNALASYAWANGAWVLSSNNGYWMGKNSEDPTLSNPYLFATPSGDIDTTTITNLRLDPTNETLIQKMKNRVEAVSYKYAYQSHEIIPVNELYSFTFNKGVREGCLNATSPSGEAFQTKVVLYTINETGKVTEHSWLEPTTYFTGNNYNIGRKSNTHTISIASSFPEAVGYVVGIEVYPYAVVPDDVKFSVLTSSAGTNFYMSYSFEYVPDGYTTKYKHYETVIPAQYNGANKAYIEGYGDGSFKPDGNITRAEISAIVTRLISDKTPVGFVSSFEDVVPGSWYYDSVSYLENAGIFDYITDTFSPDEYITRGELAKIIHSFTEVPDKEYANPFGDISEEYIYYNEIISLANAKIINGYEDGSFRPENTITRAEAVTMINRFINLIVKEDTVDEESIITRFSDVSGHWAELNILVASNDNVKTKSHVASNSALKETDDTIYFENSYAKIVLSKNHARILEIINKDSGLDVASTSLAPFFATVTSNSGLIFTPKKAEIVDGRLHIIFGNNVEAYFIIEEHGTFFTVELDCDVPLGMKSLSFGKLSVNCAFSNYDEDSYRLSAVTMDTRVNNGYNPGGLNKTTSGTVSNTLRVDLVGAKLGIAFARFGGLGTGENIGEHRSALQDIAKATDPAKGITSTVGGAYALDTPMLFEDYVITQQVTLETLDDAIETAKKYSIEIFDLHHNTYSTFKQGDFIFYGAVTKEEKAAGITYTDAKTYKERVSDVVHENGLKLALHTYAAGVKGGSALLADPHWQKQFVYNDEVYTLKEELPATTDTTWVRINETTKNLNYPPNSSDGAIPYGTIYTAFFLIDEEIVAITYTSSNFVEEDGFKIWRAQQGTTAAYHAPGAEVKQFLGIHQCFQPIAGSELFWLIADRTAQAYNEADFDMIYLDGQEGFARFCKDSENQYYYYAEFTRRILSQCIKTPTIESSAFNVNMWAAGGRYGAVDLVTRAIKKHKIGHYTDYGKPAVNQYFTGTLGWFGFDTDGSSLYKNTINKTLFRDDLDYMGSVAIGSDLSMVLNGFTPSTFKKDITESKIVENFNYYGVYTRLRKGGYFAPEVKEQIKNGKYEYRLVKKKNGYVFREMKYVDLKVWFDATDKTYNSSTSTNPFEIGETPTIRIEQRYSTLGENAITLLELDETAKVTSKTYTLESRLNLTNNQALKVNVHGNGTAKSAILISLYSTSGGGRADYFIPTNHTGWREFTLMEVENGDYDGYSFSNVSNLWHTWENFGSTISLSGVYKVMISTTGSMEGVMMDDIFACTPADAPAINPSITIGNSTMTFYDTNNADLVIHSGEYIEYYPEIHKAYLNYYEKIYNEDNEWTGNKAHTKEIVLRVTGDTFVVPSGSFTYSYSATPASEAPIRAKVHLGLRGVEIANPASWTPPTIDMGDAPLDVKIKYPFPSPKTSLRGVLYL